MPTLKPKSSPAAKSTPTVPRFKIQRLSDVFPIWSSVDRAIVAHASRLNLDKPESSKYLVVIYKQYTSTSDIYIYTKDQKGFHSQLKDQKVVYTKGSSRERMAQFKFSNWDRSQGKSLSKIDGHLPSPIRRGRCSQRFRRCRPSGGGRSPAA